MAFKLEPGRPVGAELVRAIREQLGEAIAANRARRASVHVRVHEGRTTCKRARAALALLRDQDRRACRREDRALAHAARTLGALRDAETAPACLRAVLEHHGPALPRRKFTPLVRALDAHRRATLPPRPEIQRTLARFAARLKASERRLAELEPGDDIAGMIDGLKRSYRRGRAGLAEAASRGGATAFHEWRKAVKAYSYQCRLLRAAWPPAMKELCDELKALGAMLGDEHDLTVLRKLLRALRRKEKLAGDDELVRATLGLIEARRDALRTHAIPLGERLFADRPRAVAERMMQWWRVAQDQPELTG
jgi:CHAD domain-containing protein